MHPVEAKRQQAFLAASQHQLREGIHGIQALLKQHPGHPLLLLDLAELELQTPDVGKALRMIERALPHADESLLSRASGLLHRAQQSEAALQILKRGAQDSPALRLEWAIALERMNRLDQAEAVLGECATREPMACWLEARLLRRRGETSAAIDRLRALVETKRRGADVAAKVGYELAQALDDAGEFSEAFQVLRATKDAITASIPTQAREQWDARLHAEQSTRKRLIHDVSSGQLARWFGDAAKRVELPPLAILTGHPRSGTTLLEQLLRKRNGVACVSEEQIFRRSIERLTSTMTRTAEESPLDVLDRVNEPTRDKARHLYRAFLGERCAGSTQVLLDKEPSYLDYLPVLLRFAPEMKLIVVHRDPRDVLLSALFLPVPISNPSAWAWLDPQRAAQRLRQVQGGWASLRKKWPGRVAEIHYEELVRQPEETTSSLAGFLGLSDRPSSESSDSGWITSPSYARAGEAVDAKSVGRWKHYTAELASCYETIADSDDA